MRVMLVVCGWCVALAGAAWGGGPDWTWRASGGVLYPSTTDGPFLGRAFTVGMAAPVKPWCLLGFEAGWMRVDGATEPSYFGASYRRDPWTDLTVAGTFRLQANVRVGPAPFVETTQGLSMPSGGGGAVDSPPYAFAIAEDSSVHWTTAVGFGVRVVVPGPWPDPEVALRKHLWDGGLVRSVVEPRLAVTW